MRIAYLTAGAAGMYCGSCLHDNALAKALHRLGHDALLIPTYTPILTDEANVSSDELFYGGLNVYLQQSVSLFRWLPAWSDKFLSSPKLVGWIASRAMGTSAANLGPLTVSMLKGKQGRQKKEVDRLCDWLETQAPDVVVFSNLLIAGCIPEIKNRLKCPTVVILQGDDIFYDSLTEPFRTQALTELKRLATEVDMFVVHSADYGQRMQSMLEFSDKQLQVNPLTIDVADYKHWPARKVDRELPTIGYLARLAPEKGLHLLVDAFITLQQQGCHAKLAIAGWLGKQHSTYWEQQQQKLSGAGLSDHYVYHGSVDRAGKLEFLQEIDLLSVPTTYLEPKGLFVLEGLAAGVPYAQPAHGAFPEIHERLGGGLLFDPQSPGDYVATLERMIESPQLRDELGSLGRERVLEQATMDHEAKHFADLLQSLCGT